MSSASSPVVFEDVQGLVRFAHAQLTRALYLLVRVKDAQLARQWCAGAPVTSAEKTQPPPENALQLAFTAPGLKALGLSDSILAGFSEEFLSGMAGNANRSRRLGDIGASDPAAWTWGRGTQLPHMAAMLFSRDDLEGWRRTVETATWNSAFETIARLSTTDLGGVEPFGFTDGVSQPEIDWMRERSDVNEQAEYAKVLALGEFLLGYPNEYGQYTDRPLVDPAADPANELLPAEDQPALRDFARNGTYLVLRQLEQDVRGFWAFLDRSAQSDPAVREELGAALVGRRRDGRPLLDATGLNDFTYEGDPDGNLCPLGAHIRRANPRTADFPVRPTGLLGRLAMRLGIPTPGFRRDLVAPSRLHRILRRGREYGEPLSSENALQSAPPEEGPRGLHFVCLNANIRRQFEFVQDAWLMSTKFNGLTGEGDPLLGNRLSIAGGPPSDGYSIARAGRPARKLEGLPQFVTVRGGSYFFMPGIRALRYLARGGRDRS